jgi:hypothetical protein
MSSSSSASASASASTHTNPTTASSAASTNTSTSASDAQAVAALKRENALLQQRLTALEREHASTQSQLRSESEELAKVRTVLQQTTALATLQLQAALLAGAATQPAPAEMLTDAMSSMVTINASLSSGQGPPLTPAMEALLAKQGLGPSDIGLGPGPGPGSGPGGVGVGPVGHKGALRNAIAATMCVDRSKLSLARWAAGGCGAGEKIARLEQRLRGCGLLGIEFPIGAVEGAGAELPQEEWERDV